MSLAKLVSNAISDADYIVEEGKNSNVLGNKDVQEFRSLKTELSVIEQKLDQLWVCAYLGKIFKEHPWLGKLTVTVSVESEYNDEGGYYDYASVRVSEVEAFEGVAIPTEFEFEAQSDGFGAEESEDEPVMELDTEAAEEYFNTSWFEDSGEEFKDALRVESGDEDSICVSRHDIEDLIRPGMTISAKRIFDRISAEFEN